MSGGFCQTGSNRRSDTSALLLAALRTTHQRKDGDVQYMILAMEHPSAFDSRESDGAEEYWSAWSGSVSYTHLTLPTKA